MLCSPRNKSGFTLIEVLIALVILSIALTAILKSASLNIKNLIYLENRTMATWIANNVINEVRAGVLKLPNAPASAEQETVLLNQTWIWQANLNLTPNKKIKEINVTVFLKNNSSRLGHMVGYLYV